MAGLTGRQGAAAYAVCNTWGTAASVTQQIHLRSTAGLDAEPMVVTDEVFNQDFIGPGEIGDEAPRVTDVPAVFRYETIDKLLAGAIGSPAAATVVSSQAANSLVAAQHVINLATNLTHYFTLATSFGEALPHYVQEVTSFKPRGFMVRVGDGGVMECTFSIVGNKTTYTSAVNTNSTVYGATAAEIANRVFRKQGVLRMNAFADGALDSGDQITEAREIEFGSTRPVADGDFVFGQDYIYDPDDDGVAEFPFTVTYAAMNTVTANSLVTALKAAALFKADLTFTGPYINSTTQRSMLFEWPSLQLESAGYVAEISGHGKIRPTATFKGRLATTSPTGMAFVNPLKLTIVNANSETLL